MIGVLEDTVVYVAVITAIDNHTYRFTLFVKVSSKYRCYIPFSFMFDRDDNIFTLISVNNLLPAEPMYILVEDGVTSILNDCSVFVKCVPDEIDIA